MEIDATVQTTIRMVREREVLVVPVLGEVFTEGLLYRPKGAEGYPAPSHHVGLGQPAMMSASLAWVLRRPMPSSWRSTMWACQMS